MKKRVLVVVAHPDDETIWMGGTLLRNKNRWDLTIVSLCRRSDRDRAPKFRKACAIYHAKSHMSDLEDEKLHRIELRDVTKRIARFIDGKYDYIFTHGSNGEYGHPRHKEIHRAVNQLIENKKLISKKIFFFDYARSGASCAPNRGADNFIKLNAVLLKRKRELIQDVYGFNKKSFENKCCKKTEAFKIKKIK